MQRRTVHQRRKAMTPLEGEGRRREAREERGEDRGSVEPADGGMVEEAPAREREEVGDEGVGGEVAGDCECGLAVPVGPAVVGAGESELNLREEKEREGLKAVDALEGGEVEAVEEAEFEAVVEAELEDSRAPL
jgi:hypothetical protein